MRNLISTLLLLAAFGASAQDFYAIDKIQEIRLTFAQSDWDAQLDNLKATNEEAYLLATSVTVNGETFDSVGVKYKGNSSYRASNAKNPMHIELDYVRPNQDYHGLADIKLGNGFSDPSFVREALSYEILRQYMDAPLANFAKLYINGQYYGLYSNQQSINKSFVRNHFDTDGNNPFFKCNPQSVGGPGGGGLPDLVYGTADSTTYYKRYELKSDYGWRELMALMDTLKNKPSAAVEKILDIDRTLWMLAFNNVLVNLDSYTGAFAQNYYLYQDENGRFLPIVWDLNMCFGGFQNLANGAGGGNLTLALMQNLDPLSQSTNAGRPLIRVLLSNPTWKRMYLAHVRTIAQENFSDQRYRERAVAMQAVIDSAVLTDTKKFYTYAQFKNNLDQTITGAGGGGGGFTPPGLTALMNARYTFLKNNANLTPTPPAIGTPAFAPASPAPGTTVWVTATVESANSVWIGTREQAGGVFRRTQLFDDGQHHDGAAGDKVYGAAITAGPVRLQYYLYAENDLVGQFMPQRAEYQYLVLPSNLPLPAPGEVVINEFLAENQNGSTDEKGQKEDWAELYNRTGQPKSLQGLSLTDDPTKPSKWDFPPGTILPANGYLIVWMDEDSSQGPLHANFKLRKAGEFIMLSNGAGLVYDSLSFGPQTTDISYGRYPNGTGAFTFMPTTFAAANSLVSAVWAPESPRRLLFSPNPATQTVHIAGSAPLGYLQLFDAGGRLVLQQLALREQQTEIDLDGILPGVYWIKTAGSGGGRLIVLK